MSDDKECFVIAPIDDEGSEVRDRSNKVMEYIIEEAVSDYGYSVTRADQMDQPGSITNQVIQKIVDSELVIADLTDHNPNVFYELAVRHATGEPYIQLIKSDQSIPFDISDLRTFQYGLEVDEADQTKQQIRGLLESLEDGEPEFDNPIYKSAEMQSLRESEDPSDQNLAEILDRMYKIDNRIGQLENEIKASNSNTTTEQAQLNEASKDMNVDTLSKEEGIVFNIMMEYVDDPHDSIPEDELLSKAQKQGVDEENTKHALQNLMMKGKIYEPTDNTYKII